MSADAWGICGATAWAPTGGLGARCVGRWGWGVACRLSFFCFFLSFFSSCVDRQIGCTDPVGEDGGGWMGGGRVRSGWNVTLYERCNFNARNQVPVREIQGGVVRVGKERGRQW